VYALNWVQLGLWDDFRSQKIKDSIMSRAWNYLLDVPELVKPFAESLYSVLKKHQGIYPEEDKEFNNRMVAEEHKRHEVIKAIIPLFISKQENIYLLFSYVSLIVEDDLPWLISQYEKIIDKNEKILWCKLISHFSYTFNSKYIGDLLEAKSKDLELSKALAFLDPITINSPEGRKIKAKYLKNERWHKRLKEEHIKPLLKPSPIQRVIKLLDRFEKGDKNAWWLLNREMTLEPNSTHYGDESESDIRTFPVWKKADSKMQNRLLNAAAEYIKSPPSLDTSWIGTNTFDRAYRAGYRAFVLLMNFDHNLFFLLIKQSGKSGLQFSLNFPYIQMRIMNPISL
ncbi:MAG: hypothetical protein ABFD79_12685, partial [Phycisphaerales bacterium]